MKISLLSITYAMKAKEMLEEIGVACTVVKDLRPRGGCLYAISFPDQYADVAVSTLKQKGIQLHPSEKWEDLI